MDEYEKLFSQQNNVSIMRGFDGAIQFHTKQGMLTGKQHGDTLLKYSKGKEELKKQKTYDGVKSIVQALDPSGVSNYSDTKETLSSNASIQEKVLAVAGSLPMMKYLRTPGKMSSIGGKVLKGEKAVNLLERTSKALDKVTPRTGLDRLWENKTAPLLESTMGMKRAIKGTPTYLADKAASTLNSTNKISKQDKINLAISASNIANKTGDMVNLKDAGVSLYDSYQLDKSIQDDKNAKKMENTTKKNTKQEPNKLVNKLPAGLPAGFPKYAMGGTISRPSSRQRHIAPMIIGAGLSVISGLLASSKAKKAKEEAQAATLKQERGILEASRSQQQQADNQALAEYDVEGQEDVQYYKKGGEIQPNLAKNQPTDQLSLAMQGGGLKPNLPVSNGGFQTKGGNLVPIGDGVELAVGNKHNDTKIDGVSGIQLSQGGETIAEVEDNEVIADGNVVYSDRLKYDKNKSYADTMKALTKKRNKLEKEQEDAPNKAKKNSIDRQLAGLNMAEQSLFKTQEIHKEVEGKAVLNNIFANGGLLRKDKLGRPLPVPKWMQTFYGTQKGGKYDGYATNALGDYRDPKDPAVVISANAKPKYPYDPTPYKTKAITPIMDKSAGMSDGSGELLKGVTDAATTVVGSMGTDSNKGGTPNTTVTTPEAVTEGTGPANGTAFAKKAEWAGTSAVDNSPGTSTLTTTTTMHDSTSNKNGKKVNIDWTGIGKKGLSLAPKLIDNLVNRAQTRNAPELPTLLNSVATPLETRININPALADARRRNATLRKSILNNSSSSNNAKSNMIATSLMTGRQTDELLVNKENQEMALRNANSQNRQAVANSNIAQANERSMMEFSRQNDLNTRRSANAANLVGDITSTINEYKVGQQFDADVKANLMDDPEGSKAILYAQDNQVMSNPTLRNTILQRAKILNSPALNKILKDNNYID